MAKIIYKKGTEGQNMLSCIEGIEIDLLNGQKALIYPKYAERPIFVSDQGKNWRVEGETEIEALKNTDTTEKTNALLKTGSMAAEWVSQFYSKEHGRFNLSSLLAAVETQHQKKEIDDLAKTIEGADLLENFTSYTYSSSWRNSYSFWYTDGDECRHWYGLYDSFLVVPTILYR